MREEGIVQVFVEFAEGLIDRLSDQINLGGDVGSLAETRRAAAAALFRALRHSCLLLNEDHIVRGNLRAKHAHADKEAIIFIRQGRDNGLVVHAEHADRVADVENRGLCRLYSLLLRRSLFDRL